MTEFVGRTGSRRLYSYPETPRGGGALAFARNSAVGPDAPLAITQAGVLTTWSAVESLAVTPPNTTNVPITPRVTGVARVICTLVVQNLDTTQIVEAILQLGGAPIASFPNTILGPGEGPDEVEVITFVFDFNPTTALLPLNVAAQISVLLLASVDDTSLQLNTATIDIQELPAATG